MKMEQTQLAIQGDPSRIGHSEAALGNLGYYRFVSQPPYLPHQDGIPSSCSVAQPAIGLISTQITTVAVVGIFCADIPTFLRDPWHHPTARWA